MMEQIIAYLMSGFWPWLGLTITLTLWLGALGQTLVGIAALFRR